MKHNINELYYINGTYYTEEVAKQMFNDYVLMGTSGIYHTGNTIKVCVGLGQFKTYWMYGEKTFFDTQEERDTYREQRYQEQDQGRRRRKALRTINDYLATLSTDDLEDLIKGLN